MAYFVPNIMSLITFAFLLCLVCPAVFAVRLHLAREVTLECTDTQHSALSYAQIPHLAIGVFPKGPSRHVELANVALDPRAGNYLVLSSDQCDQIGFKQYVGKQEPGHNDTYQLFDDAQVTMYDIKNPGFNVQGRVRVACVHSERPILPSLGLNALVSLFHVEVEGNNVYTVINEHSPRPLRIARAV